MAPCAMSTSASLASSPKSLVLRSAAIRSVFMGLTIHGAVGRKMPSSDLSHSIPPGRGIGCSESWFFGSNESESDEGDSPASSNGQSLWLDDITLYLGAAAQLRRPIHSSQPRVWLFPVYIQALARVHTETDLFAALKEEEVPLIWIFCAMPLVGLICFAFLIGRQERHISAVKENGKWWASH